MARGTLSSTEEPMAHVRRKQARHYLTHLAIAGAAALTMLSAALPDAARAENATINELVFAIQPPNFPSTINVTASGNNKWDTIQAGNVLFGAHMKVDTAYPGWVDRAAIYLGRCENSQCGNGYPQLFGVAPATRDFEREMDVVFPTSKIPVSGPGIAVVPYRNATSI